MAVAAITRPPAERILPSTSDVPAWKIAVSIITSISLNFVEMIVWEQT